MRKFPKRPEVQGFVVVKLSGVHVNVESNLSARLGGFKAQELFSCDCYSCGGGSANASGVGGGGGAVQYLLGA